MLEGREVVKAWTRRFAAVKLTPVRRRALAFVLLVVASATAASAATGQNVGGRAEVFAGGELESYLRYLQTLGEVAPYPWGIRAFSPVEVDRLMPRDTANPWAARYDLARHPAHGLQTDWVAPAASVRFNSTFPYGYNDGPIWAGRGLTVSGQAGVALRWGMLSLTIAPMFFVAQNAAFPLMANGRSGSLAYASGVVPGQIDLPQRFGNSAYARLDPGQSTFRVDWGPLAAGLTTADQYWGPATTFPIILGNNAAGFPQVFLGTAQPVDLWLLRIHFRFIWGRLGQSAYSPETAAGGLRYANGLNANLTSRWVPGLEVGFTRFSHQPWPAGGPRFSDLIHVLRFQETGNAAGNVIDNQLASAYFRWVLPHSGFEVYGEYGRDDYNQNLRDLILEPDHIGGYTVGFRKVWRRSGNRLLAVRAEVQNLQYSVLAQGRPWSPFYSHSTNLRQGHTQLGQMLASPAGPGGAGSVVAVDAYSPKGRWTFSWTRMLRAQQGDSAQPAQAIPRAFDVQHELAVERLAFRGRYDVLAHVGVVYEFNRYFKSDAFNLNLILGVRMGLR
jgi:Capsule assembly protein Wzi